MAAFGSDQIASAARSLRNVGIEVTWVVDDQGLNGPSPLRADDRFGRAARLASALSSEDYVGVIGGAGGWNSIELLSLLDFGSLRGSPPKVFMGMSDLTTLTTALYARLQWPTVYGANFTMLGVGEWPSADLARYGEILRGSSEPIKVEGESGAVRSGHASGRVFGGHLGTLCLLVGTPYWPKFQEPVVLFVEDDALLGSSSLKEALRRLDGLLLIDELRARMSALILGRFETRAETSPEVIAEALVSHPALRTVPLLVDVPFGHAHPGIPLPIGGLCDVHAGDDGAWSLSIRGAPQLALTGLQPSR